MAEKKLTSQQAKKLAKRAAKLVLQTPVDEQRVSEGLSILEMPNRELRPRYFSGSNELVHVTLFEWMEKNVPNLVDYDRGRHEIADVQRWLDANVVGKWMKAVDHIADQENSLIVSLRFSAERDASLFKVAFA